MKNYDLSIIIPYHNNVVYLKKLLDSIKYFDKIQVLVVNDFSDKNIIEYNELKSNDKYKEVKFIDSNSKNRGAGAARNIGLDYATGKWLLFADSDDYFVDGYYNIIKKYCSTDYEVIFFVPTSKDLDTGNLADRHIFMKDKIKVYNLNLSKKNSYYLRYRFYTPWSKLIKRELVEKNNIRFHEVIAKNDSLFSIKVGHYMKKFLATEEIIYCATWHSNGNITKRKDIQFVVDSTKSRIKLLAFLRENLSKEDLDIINYENIAYYLIEDFKRADIKKEYIEESVKLFKENGISVYNTKNFVARIKYYIKKLIGR